MLGTLGTSLLAERVAWRRSTKDLNVSTKDLNVWAGHASSTLPAEDSPATPSPDRPPLGTIGTSRTSGHPVRAMVQRPRDGGQWSG